VSVEGASGAWLGRGAVVSKSQVPHLTQSREFPSRHLGVRTGPFGLSVATRSTARRRSSRATSSSRIRSVSTFPDSGTVGPAGRLRGVRAYRGDRERRYSLEDTFPSSA
jgi:hypothetical protein